MSNGLTKYEVSAVAQKAGCAWLHEPLAQRFATLCRAPLLAEAERLKKDLSTYDKRIVALSCIAMEDVHELLALQADRDDWKARALKAEQAGGPVGEVTAHDNCRAERICRSWCGNLACASHYAPQPAAQESDCATTGVCVRSGLYASPPSAVPVVEQMVEALEDAQRAFSPAIHVGVSSAIEAGQKFIKENGK